VRARVALFVRATGQHGAYLARTFNTGRVDRLYADPMGLFIHCTDLTDATTIIRLIHKVKSAPIYGLGTQTQGKGSFKTPEYTANTEGLDTLLLASAPIMVEVEALRECSGSPARRDNLLPLLSLRGRQALRLLDHGQLPRCLSAARLERHFFQPREPPCAARRSRPRKTTRAGSYRTFLSKVE
jgi:GDP-mannose 4,6 dehydratase